MARPRKTKTSKPYQADHLNLDQPDALSLFLPVVSEWFRLKVGTPTDAQIRGWPSIQSGQNTLIVAPTGSGKTLAAFMAGLDALWRQKELPDGVQILYISPLKALNQDIYRNLDRPLLGVAEVAESRGILLPKIRTGVRTGDTPQNERQAQARKPPHVLITTPESLHLILGGRARAMLSGVKWVIVDELHALAGQKRGTFLAILLERLVHELGRDPVRIGLTATVNPIEEAGKFLCGFHADPNQWEHSTPRPLTIVRALVTKQWDLMVKRAEAEADPNQPRTIWPNLEKELTGLIGSHQSTLVFANNRYLVERLAARINEQVQSANQELQESSPDDNSESDNPIGHAWVHAHHGSISLDRRRQTEIALKDGRLKGVISTASLEMGIDMGAVDLVCQIGSPGEVARGLQRVGRAGHGVGEISKGRFFAKTNADLLETAALVEAMTRSAVEPLAIPQNCLDMLAQQVVACVAVRTWKPRELLQLFRRSYPYQNLSEKAFESVLEMLSGRFRVEAIRDLKARIFWDRVRDELSALPGTSSLALMGGGAIPDTGQYPVKLGDKGPTLGSLDEEFVLERRAGEAFRLGSSTWRIDRIEADRVIVSPSGGSDMVVMPFWRGEESRRSATLGASIGSLLRRIAADENRDSAVQHLVNICCLDHDSASDLVRFIHRQKRMTGFVPDDRTIIVESFRDPAGEVALAILSPWGGRVNQALKLVLQNRLFAELGFRPAAQHADDGLMMRLPRDVQDRPPLDLLDNLGFDEASERLREELADSSLFGLRFRQNAARSLLLPRPDPGKRTPLWLQRLRAKDLLQVVRQMPDFPVVLECYRECLSQDLDLNLLKTLLDSIQNGEIRVVKHTGESASPFASDLMNRFERKFLYEWDEPHKAKATRERAQLADVPPGEVLDELLDPTILKRVEDQLAQAWSRPAKSAEDLAERFLRLGDLADHDVVPDHRHWIEDLKKRSLVQPVFENTRVPTLWISSEDLPVYHLAFPEGFELDQQNSFNAQRQSALDHILRRFVSTRSLISLKDVTSRYPIETSVAANWLQEWTEKGGFTRITGNSNDKTETRWADTRQMQRMVGMSLAQRRHDVKPVSPECWADWVLRNEIKSRKCSVNQSLETIHHILLTFQGWAATVSQWAEEILPRRVPGFQLQQLDRLLQRGDWSWRVVSDSAEKLGNPKIAFWHCDFPQPNFTQADFHQLSTGSAEILKLIQSYGPMTSSEISLKTGVTLSSIRNDLRECLQNGYIVNEKLAFLENWCNSDSATKQKQTSNLKLKSPTRKINRFRRLLAEQGVGVGGLGPGLSHTSTDGLAMEGRWKIIATDTPFNVDDSYSAWCALLIARYGVITREVVKFAAAELDWSSFADWLEAAEWRDELRRGYFVEGLSGMQFTDAQTAAELAEFSDEFSNKNLQEFYLVSAIDPLNLYGSSAPLDLPLLENGRVRLPRVSGNMLLFYQGMPLWITQERGKKLTSLPHRENDVMKLALQFLVQSFIGNSTKWTIITLDDNHAAKSPWALELTELGFFRDGLALTRYRGLV